jgi:hypothetical protein
VDGATAAKSGHYQEAVGLLERALGQGLSESDQVLARYHLGRCYEEVGNLTQARLEYAVAVAMDDTLSTSTRWRQWCLERIRILGGSNLSITSNPPGVKFRLVGLAGGGTGKLDGRTPGNVYGLREGTYGITAESDDHTQGAWEVVTLGRAENRVLPLSLADACVLYVGVQPAGSKVTVRFQTGIEVTETATLEATDRFPGARVSCPVGKHRLEVSAPGFETVSREVVFDNQGDKRWVATISLQPRGPVRASAER